MNLVGLLFVAGLFSPVCYDNVCLSLAFEYASLIKSSINIYLDMQEEIYQLYLHDIFLKFFLSNRCSERITPYIAI